MSTSPTTFGLSEQEYRTELQDELTRAMRSEGGEQTIHAIAHAIARVASLDHLRIGEQLEAAGVRIGPVRRAPETRGWPMD